MVVYLGHDGCGRKRGILGCGSCQCNLFSRWADDGLCGISSVAILFIYLEGDAFLQQQLT